MPYYQGVAEPEREDLFTGGTPSLHHGDKKRGKRTKKKKKKKKKKKQLFGKVLRGVIPI